MKNFKCTFYRTDDVNLKEWHSIIEKLRSDLEILNSGEIDCSSVADYVHALCLHAKPLEINPRMSFFGMDEPRNMPSDARVDFFYRPTYYAAAIMTKAILLYPELLERKAETEVELSGDELRTVLSSCLLGCTGRDFRGHGYDNIQGLAATMEIFAESDMMNFVTKYPDICSEFTQMYDKTLNFIMQAVEKGGLSGAWGDDYTECGKRILEKNGISF